MDNSRKIPLILLVIAVIPHFLIAHFTWIVPARQDKAVLIGHGHSFPSSEQALAPAGLQIILLDSQGKTHAAQPEQREKEVRGSLPADLDQLAAACFLQEAVIITRTTSGVKRGSMKEHSGVIDSFRRLRSGFYQSAPGVELPVFADRLILQAEHRDGRLQFFLRLGAEPLAGVAVKMAASGQEEATEIGQTDASGRLAFKPEKPGLYLFSADYSREVKHDEYLREQFAATLALQLK